MQILNFPCKIDAPTAVALGRFDGIHLAHKEVISCAVNNKENLVPAVFTFCDNPGKTPHGTLTTQEEKHEQIAALGAKLLIDTRFDSVRNLSAEEFVDNILCDALNAKAVYCGYNYRFGKGACADVETLRTLCAKKGISVTCTDEIDINGYSVSSTAIRNLLSQGNVRTAAELLGRNYSLSGEVIHGNALGRTIETPTLNIAVDEEKMLPLYGVYASLATIEGVTYKAITNIGVKPTVGSETPTTETYLFNTKGDFYSKVAEIELVEFLRKEQKFSTMEDLKEAIAQDIKRANEIL